jgi:hypothetical protein
MSVWMRFAAVLLVVTCGCSLLQAAGQKLAARQEKDKIVVAIDGKLFTSYKFAADQKYPYLWPVIGPLSGKSITTETSEPYPHHHSLFFGCDRVNGGNYWQDVNARGQILSQGPKIVTASGERIVLTDTCLWKQPDKDPVIEDTRQIIINAPSETLRIIDFKITLTPLVDIEILKTNHSLFSARVVPELSVNSGGTLINAQGDTSEKGTFDVASPWCDYSGAWQPQAQLGDGLIEGIAILQNPANRWYPSVWFTRDYGFFSPTPMNWLEGGKLNLSKGQKLTLAYRVLVHAGNAKTADVAGLFEQYKQSAQ